VIATEGRSVGSQILNAVRMPILKTREMTLDNAYQAAILRPFLNCCETFCNTLLHRTREIIVPDYFKPWRRKIGVVTLMLGMTFAAG